MALKRAEREKAEEEKKNQQVKAATAQKVASKSQMPSSIHGGP